MNSNKAGKETGRIEAPLETRQPYLREHYEERQRHAADDMTTVAMVAAGFGSGIYLFADVIYRYGRTDGEVMRR